jgi:L-threonylcarbamoyladenylate synthase
MDIHIQQAVNIINQGGIIIFPTDTAFGIGCRIDKQDAVDRFFTLRKRSRTQATPVLVGSVEMALPYYDSPSGIVRRLMTKYWPGALTIISTCNEHVLYSPIRGGGKNIGLRMPDNETILNVITQVGVPIIGSSANFHGAPTPYSFDELDPELVKLVDYVLPGSCCVKEASTVVDCSCNPYRIIRQGAIQIEI